MTVDSDTSVREARRIGVLWSGLLLPPLAFLTNLAIAYALVPRACTTNEPLLLHLVHFVSLLLTLAGGLVAWRVWRATGAEWPGDAGGPLGRSRFLAGSGLLSSGMFALVILAQWFPGFVLDPCQ
jgi:hypothetical protein